MSYFKLPESTIVNRNIPKKSFDTYMSARQKVLLSTCFQKITWINKLSTKTTSLQSKNVIEIQIFKIEVKNRNDIVALLNSIDKVIPYHIVFILEDGDSILASTAEKHLHPTIVNQSVIDWRFQTEWFSKADFNLTIDLKSSLDDVFKMFCNQISGKKYHG